MNDSNSNRKAAARQENMKPSHYEQGRAYLRDGLHKSATRYSEISQKSTPGTSQVGQVAWAGRSDYGKSASHFGKGFMQGVSQQNPNSGQQLNNMKINQAITEGKANANQVIKNNSYTPKANQVNQQKAVANQSSAKTSQPYTNKGIEAVRQKAAEKQSGTNTKQSSNQGIKSYKSQTSGQSSGASKSSAGGASKGSSGGQSSGSSKGR